MNILDKLKINHRPSAGALDLLKYIGPGLLVTVGFIDPGNWATNLAAGSEFGYALLWVVTFSSIMLIIIQHNVAHLGIVTGLCLSEATNKYMPRVLSRPILISAMLASISTSLAEVLGGAIALRMLFGMPIKVGAVIVTYQTNNEALRLLGLAVFTNVRQLARIDENLKTVIQNIQPGDKHQISFTNERGNVHLSIRVSEMTLQDKHVRILAINDINSELDDKEIDSWIRLTRVLTHEIMNSVTPITSLSDTLLSLHQNADDEIRNGLEVISTTGKSLISFVESYRKFTHIPTPEPTLFYVQKFAERMVKLARHHTNFPNITINVSVEPSDLIVYADENLISQVVLNLLKNAMQAIGCEQADGLIEVKAYCNEEEAVLIEVSNNGPVIPQEEAEHIFVPFFTTKEGGSGIGLSISRQIMRLSGGSIALKSAPAAKRTTFVLTFP